MNTINQKNLYRIILTLSICLHINIAYTQTIQTRIDFEAVVNGVDGGTYDYLGGEPWNVGDQNAINTTNPYTDFNDYFWQNYNVRFWSGGLNSGTTPNIAEYGVPFGAFTYPNPNLGSDSLNPDPLVQPLNFTGIGNYFLTTYQPNGSPQPLFIDYNQEKIQCSQASGFVLDIDGDESWVIDVFSASYAQPVASIVLCSPSNTSTVAHPTHSTYPNLNSLTCNTEYDNIGNTSQPISSVFSGDGIATYWSVDLSVYSETIDYLRFTYTGTGSPGLGFDNFSFCSAEPIEPDSAIYCCDGENLLTNGSFENGTNGFTSKYDKEDNLNPGQYAVIDVNDAFAICSNWDVQDHTYCESGINNSNVLIVNGQTQQSNNSDNVIWETAGSIDVEEGQEYKFCGFANHLAQCCFDVVPNIAVEFSVDGGNTWGPITNWEPVVYTGPEPEECAWKQIGGTFTASGTSVHIRILLDEMSNGDGNDLALDDLSLTQLAEQPFLIDIDPVVTSDPNVYEISASYKTSSTTDDILPDTSCKYMWLIAENPGPVDMDNPFADMFSWTNSQWGGTGSSTNTGWGLTTSFAGYNGGFPNGIFEYKKYYLIMLFIIDCECQAANFTHASYYNFGYNNLNSDGNTQGLVVETSREIKLPESKKKEILKSFENLTSSPPPNFNNQLSQKIKPEVEVFPNPTNQNLYLKLQNYLGKTGSISITNYLGQEVLNIPETVFRDPTLKIDLPLQIPQGTYFLNLTTGYERQVVKFVIARE